MLAPIHWERDPGDPAPNDNRTPKFMPQRIPSDHVENIFSG